MIGFQVLAAAVAVVLGQAVADASAIFSIERLSDTQIRITGSGTIDSRPAMRGPRLRFGRVFTSAPTANGSISGTMDFQPTFSITVTDPVYYEDFSGFDADHADGLRIDSGWPEAGDAVSGTITVTMPDGIFAAVGATGLFGAGNNNSGVVYELGNWEMVDPIPEPSTFALAVLGLVGLLACRRRRRD